LRPVIAAIGCFVLALGFVSLGLSYLITGYNSEQIDATLSVLGLWALMPIGVIILVIGVATGGKTRQDSLRKKCSVVLL